MSSSDDGCGSVIGLALGIFVVSIAYIALGVFLALIVPIALLFFKDVPLIWRGLAGIAAFGYFIFEIGNKWPSAEFWFFGREPWIGIEYLLFLNLATYIALGLSMFMVYLGVLKLKS